MQTPVHPSRHASNVPMFVLHGTLYDCLCCNMQNLGVLELDSHCCGKKNHLKRLPTYLARSSLSSFRPDALTKVELEAKIPAIIEVQNTRQMDKKRKRYASSTYLSAPSAESSPESGLN